MNESHHRQIAKDSKLKKPYLSVFRQVTPTWAKDLAQASSSPA